MQPSNKRNPWQRLLVAAIVVCAALVAYSVYAGLRDRSSTGVLDVSTSETQSVITLSANGTRAEIIGTGTAQVRVKPGYYQLAANHNGNHAITTVRVTKGNVTKSSLKLSKTVTLPSVNEPGFINFDVLVNSGISSTQETNLEQLFQTYAPQAQIVSVDAASITAEPHDPNGTSADFGLDFTGTIDTKPFSARLIYTGFESVNLTLTDPATGAQLYSGRAPSAGDS